jgi:hypothetical protein
MSKYKYLRAILIPALAMALLAGSLAVSQPVRAVVLWVTNTNDSGSGSLRQAIVDANDNPGPDTIRFDIPGCADVCLIQPSTPLPALTDDETIIAGYSQPGSDPATGTTAAIIKLQIDGAAAGMAHGLEIQSTGNRIGGLAITGFDMSGIYISSASDNIIVGDYIGLEPDGFTGNGNDAGIIIEGPGAHHNTIGDDTAAERNVISGNEEAGIALFGTDVKWNVVSGNYIGTDAGGTAPVGNYHGIYVGEAAQSNTFGGGTPSERNVISGNEYCGLMLHGDSVSGNTVSGNYIGTDASGSAELGNGLYGVELTDGPQNNTIGGTSEGQRNVISGNDDSGVAIRGDGTSQNTVSGNYIGTDALGTGALANTGHGVFIYLGAQLNTIGGTSEGQRNVISGNEHAGICIVDASTTNNTVAGNHIGTDAGGAAALPNLLIGVSIGGGARLNTVGPHNVIAYNGTHGVGLYNTGTLSNFVTQNSIFGNGGQGIYLGPGTQGDIAAPVLTGASLGSVEITGTACGYCVVEVFENSDDEGEGEIYLGMTNTDQFGAFALTVHHLDHHFLTATATQAISGTSEFSAPFETQIDRVLLPLALRDY